MTANSLPFLPELFCKPSGKSSDIYSTHIPNGNLIFRSLCLAHDLDTIHYWSGEIYSRRFWQMNRYSKQELQKIYLSILQNPNAHSFIAFLNGVRVAQVDIYQVLIDELRNHIQTSPNDCGIHLLMHPPKESTKNLSLELLKAFACYYFSFDLSGNLFAEPDEKNAVANLLAKKTGFNFLKNIQLSYKTANLYCLTKEQFYASNQIL